MSDQSQMSDQMTSEVTPNATSSQASLFGPTLSDSPDGPTIDPAGQEAVLARRSRAQAKAKGLMTLVTSGRHGGPSSASVALQSSLESRLHQRFDTAGGTLYPLIWKVLYCTDCGAELIELPDLLCTTCKRPVFPTDRFCGFCGKLTGQILTVEEARTILGMGVL